MNEDNELSEEEQDAEAEKMAQQFLARMQVEAVVEGGTVNFRVLVPVVEGFMDLDKLGLPEGAPLPRAVGMLMQTEMPVMVWQTQSQPTIREAVKRQVTRHLVESGVILDS